MALKKTPIDVFMAPVSQRPSDHDGPVGRVEELINGVAKRFRDTEPRRLLIETRDGFTRLTDDVRDPSGATASFSPSDASFLSELDKQTVAIEDRRPRIYNDVTVPYWTRYSNETIATNRITEETVFGGYGTSKASNHEILNGIEACCWTESTGDQPDKLVIGFRVASDRGNWIVAPHTVYTAEADMTVVGHWATDGTRFFLFYNVDALIGGSGYDVKLFDVHGVQVGAGSFTKNEIISPGHWDVIRSADVPAEVLFVQPADDTDDPDVDVHVEFTRVSFDTMTDLVVITQDVDEDVSCNGPVGWMKNDRDLVHNFLITVGPSEVDRAHVYRQAALATDVDYGGWDTPGPIDAISGFCPTGAYLYGLIGTLETESNVGPQWQPAKRAIYTYRIPVAIGTISQVRVSREQCMVTKPFNIGSDYLLTTFYQSGQGYADPEPLEPTLAVGDYFIGSALQDLVVKPGNRLNGSPVTVESNKSIGFSGAASPVGITGADTVAEITASGIAGVPDGTILLQWTFANLTITGTPYGSWIHPIASSIASANHSWFVIDNPSTHVFRTMATSVAGLTVVPGTFSATGNVEIIGSAVYNFADIDSVVPPVQRPNYILGDLVVTGNATPGNNGTFDIWSITYAGTFPNTLADLDGIRVPLTTQSFDFSGFVASISPVFPNVWFLDPSNGNINNVGSSLVVTGDDVNNSNNGTFEVTDFFGLGQFETANETTLISEIFAANSLPDIKLQLGPDKIAYSFFIADLASALTSNPQRFIGATIEFVSDVTDDNSGSYRIIGYKPDLSGLLYAERIVTSDRQVTQSLTASDSIVIYFDTNQEQLPFQPTFFLTPATGERATVGCFDRILAYNDWRILGENLLCGHLSSVITGDGYHFLLPSRQEAVTSFNEVSQIVPGTTVGVKRWKIDDGYGKQIQPLIPGTQAVSYEGDAFPEDGFSLALEAPYLVSQSTADPGQLALTAEALYSYQFVAETQDSRGNRVFSPPSPPFLVRMTGTNNVNVIGGVLNIPWYGTATPISGEYGVTNHRLVALSVYRSSMRNGVEIIQKFKLTNDLAPNQLSPVSDSNDSGFTFGDSTDHVTFTFTDQNPDELIQASEPLYAGLPRFGAPNFYSGADWLDRKWIITSDGTIWPSSAVTDDVRQSFFPGIRIKPPTFDRPVACAGMDKYLIVSCEKSMHWLPAVQLPDANGRNGVVPSLVKLPFNNGAIHGVPMLTTPAGVLYASTAGGIWCVTRALDNQFFSLDVPDWFAGKTVTDMAIDADQRLMITVNADYAIVYDFVSRLWSKWPLPQGAYSCAISDGKFVVRDLQLQLELQTTDQHVDDTDAIWPIPLDVTLSSVSFGSIRAFSRLYRTQVEGEVRGPCNLNSVTSFPDDFPNDPTTRGPTPVNVDEPFLYEFTPNHGKSSNFKFRIFSSFEGIEEPGDSFAIEALTCEVGVDQGIRPVKATQRMR